MNADMILTTSVPAMIEARETIREMDGRGLS